MRTIEQIQRDGLPGNPGLPPGVSQRMIDRSAGEDQDGVRYEDLNDIACERLQDSFYYRISGSLDLFADVVEAMQAEGGKRAELERRILRSLYDDMDSAMQSQGVTLDHAPSPPDQAEGLRQAMREIALCQSRDGMDRLADALEGIRNDLRQIARAS